MSGAERFDGEVRVSSEDVVVIQEDHAFMFQCCCDCGLWHKIHIDRPGNVEIRLRFERLEGRPVVGVDVDRIETYIEAQRA